MKTVRVATLLLGAAQLHAVTLISHYSNNLSTPQEIGSAVVAFTLPSDYVSVVISARVFTASGAGEFGTKFGNAFLLDAIGPGTTPNVVASNSFSTDFKPGSGPAPNVGLFSGLSLSAGTYYLMLQPTTGSNNPMMWETTTDGPNLAPGVVSALNYALNVSNTAGMNDTFSPVDTLNRLQYRVDGRQAQDGVPEPSSFLLLGLGAIGIYFRRR